MALVQWVSEKEACERIARSSRTLERLRLAGVVESKLEQRSGRKPERLYGAASLERCATEGAEMEAQRKEQAVAVATRSAPGGLALFGDAISTALHGAMAQWLNRPTEKLWLTLSESRIYSGLGKKDLLQLAEEGKVRTRMSGHRRVFLRRSLESFEG